MDHAGFLTGNLTLDLAIFAWFIAQLLKTLIIGQICGWRDPLFSLSAAVALVVMYDACNVRRAAGEQAKVLNYVREHWADLPEEFQGKKLNEHLGHTLPQVIMGALLGTAIGLIGPMIW